MNTQAKTLKFLRNNDPRTNVDVADGGLLEIFVDISQISVGQALERFH
jgi:hypothetical protein